MKNQIKSKLFVLNNLKDDIHQFYSHTELNGGENQRCKEGNPLKDVTQTFGPTITVFRQSVTLKEQCHEIF
jgi:hypothetical protein